MKSQRAPFTYGLSHCPGRIRTVHHMSSTGRYFYPMDTQYVGNMGSSYGNQWIRLKKSTADGET